MRKLDIYVKALTVLTIASAALSLSTVKAEASNIPPGVSISGIDISGKNGEEAKQLIKDKVKAIEDKNIEIDLEAKKINSDLSELGLVWSNEQEGEELIDSLTSGNIVKRYKAKSDYDNDASKKINLELSLDKVEFDKFLDENTKDFMDKAVDAKLSRENGEFKITPEKDGLNLDRETTKRNIESLLLDDSDSINVKASVQVEKAKVRQADLEKINDVLGTYTTDYASSSEARASNIKVGADKLGGHLLMPGEVLSGYEQMHPFTVANGYKIAHAYENGRVVDSVGGGACQIATTLYNAALRAEIAIPQRQNHSMTVSYVPASCDAAIAGTYKDIKIQNNQDSPIYVEAYTSGRKLTFTIWGDDKRPAGRTIEFVPEVLSNTPAGITYKDDPSLPSGTEVRESSGHNGRTSKLWKVVKQDGVEVERTLLSTDRYMVSNHIYRRGTGAAAAPSLEDPGNIIIDEGPGSGDKEPTQPGTEAPVGPGFKSPSVEPAPTVEPQGPGL